NDKVSRKFVNKLSHKEVYLESFEIIGLIKTGSSFEFEFRIYSSINIHIEIALTFSTRLSQPIYQLYSGHVGEKFFIIKGDNIINCKVDYLPLVHGSYEINIWVGTSSAVYDFHKNALTVN